MVKLSKLVTLTTGGFLALGCFGNQEAIAATVKYDFADESIEKIDLIVNEVSIAPQTSSTDYLLDLQLKVSFRDQQGSPGERTWFINREGNFNTVGSRFILKVDFCKSSDPSSVCYSLFDRPRTINNNTASGTEFSRIFNDQEDPIIKLLTNGDNNNVRLEAILFGSPSSQTLRQSTTEKSAFFVSTPAPEPAAVPEPLTILGSATAIGFGTFFKRKLNRKKASSKKA
ncbi:MAG: PEP-CTERM sorting domain-containing protein [Crocosphaera sp.]|nr:PEP-CTERM sorting domain-containing protein [Crocosphaera sp.]